LDPRFHFIHISIFKFEIRERVVGKWQRREKIIGYLDYMNNKAKFNRKSVVEVFLIFYIAKKVYQN